MPRRRSEDPFEEYHEYTGEVHVGEARSDVFHFLYDDEYEEFLDELREKERRRIKPGFSVQDNQEKRVRKQRTAKKSRKTG